ncbi:hypothetical protein ABEX95_16830 [Bacillus subtilis]
MVKVDLESKRYGEKLKEVFLMLDNNVVECIKEITESSRNGKLVFFVGAGVSTLSDYPQWWRLVDKYHEELYGSPKKGTILLMNIFEFLKYFIMSKVKWHLMVY